MMLAGAVHRGEGGDDTCRRRGLIMYSLHRHQFDVHDAGRCCASWWRRWWRTWRMLGDSGRPVFTPRCWSSLVASPPRWDVCCCRQHEIVRWLLVLILVTTSGFRIPDFPLLVPVPFLSSYPRLRMTFPFLPDTNLQDDKTLKCNYWFVFWWSYGCLSSCSSPEPGFWWGYGFLNQLSVLDTGFWWGYVSVNQVFALDTGFW